MTPQNVTAEYLDTKQAAVALGTTITHMERLRRKGGGPQFCKIGAKAVRYRRDWIDGWLEQRCFANTAEAKEAARARAEEQLNPAGP
jgi:predicted DNA-binding transcriptional regulator AlpA